MKIKYIITKEKENHIKCYRETTFLWMKKRKRMLNEKFFMKIAESRILPETHNITFIEYLYYKYSYNMNNKIGDFGCPITVEIDEYSDDFQEEKGKYVGNYTLVASLYDPNSNLIQEMTIKEKTFTGTFKPSKELFRALISLSYSGIFGSARDEDIYLNKIIPNEYKWSCTACGEKFKNLDEFYSHILDKKHKCIMLFKYPYDEELFKIKKVIFKEEIDRILKMFSI